MTRAYDTTMTLFTRPGARASARDSETSRHVTVPANWIVYLGGLLL